MTAWYDRRIPAPEECVLQPLLDRRARESPDKVFVKFADSGATWSYRELREQVLETAAGLGRAARGAGPDMVAQRA